MMPPARDSKFPWYFDGTETRLEFVSWKNTLEQDLQRHPHPEMSSTHCASLYLIGKAKRWYETNYDQKEPKDLATFFKVIGAQFCPAPQIRHERRYGHQNKRSRRMKSEHHESIPTLVERQSKKGGEKSTQNGTAVGPILLNAEDNQWEVRELIDHRHKLGERQFHVWFTGCEKTDAEWISEVDIDEALVAKYCTSWNLKPGRLTRKTKS